MNIFVPYPEIIASVRALDDLRLNKMILEDAQMLCDALRARGVDNKKFPRMYKKFNPKHSCTIWAGSTSENFKWLVRHGAHLEIERLLRGMKRHKSLQIISKCLDFLPVIPKGDLQPFVNCTKDYKHIEDVHEAYRRQLQLKWFCDEEKPVWSNREIPEFYRGWYKDPK
jgi:hypothetical protein